MSKSDWIKLSLFLLPLLGVLSLGALFGQSKWKQYAADRNAAAAEYEEGIEARVSVCREPDNFIAFLSCAYEASNPDQGDYTSQKDLRAQQDMSIWAFGMFVVSVATLFVTAFGAFFVWLTLKKTDETNQAAINAAEAATKANDIMLKEQRPWLDFEIQEFGEFQTIGWEGGKKSIVFFPKVKITNHGKNIAKDVNFDVRVWEGRSFDDTQLVNEFFREKTREQSDKGYVVFPSQDFTWEDWGAGHKVQQTPQGKGSDSSVNSFWFLAMLVYRMDKEWFFTSKAFSCEAFEFETGNSTALLNLRHVSWGDVHK